MYPRLRHRSTRPALPGGVLRPAGASPSGPPRQDSVFSIMAVAAPTLLVQVLRSSFDIAPHRSAHAFPVLEVSRHPSPRPHCRPVGRVGLSFEPHDVFRPDTLVDRFGRVPPGCCVDELLLRIGARCPLPVPQAFELPPVLLEDVELIYRERGSRVSESQRERARTKCPGPSRPRAPITSRTSARGSRVRRSRRVRRRTRARCRKPEALKTTILSATASAIPVENTQMSP